VGGEQAPLFGTKGEQEGRNESTQVSKTGDFHTRTSWNVSTLVPNTGDFSPPTSPNVTIRDKGGLRGVA